MAKMNRTMTVNRNVTVNSKTPQVNALVKILSDITAPRIDGTCTEDELRNFLTTDIANMLHTRQDPWLIFAYYRRQLLDSGFLALPGVAAKQVREYGWEYAL